MKNLVMLGALAAALAAGAVTVDVTGTGVEKTSVSVTVAHPMYAKCLKRNLELSGLFVVRDAGSIKVSGTPGAVLVQKGGKGYNVATPFADDKAARMAARKLSDFMCETFGNQKGFANDKVIFLNRGKQAAKGKEVPGELCLCYPDGYDIRQLTSDRAAAIYPRWKDADSIFYIGYLKGAPQILEFNTATGSRSVKWSFKGTPTGIAVSPDGRRAAAILSFQGNPELYVLDIATGNWTRLTNTKFASEGQPCWSPDGRKIVYVSDETRTPQLYVIDVNTKAKHRLTSKGSQNVDPDWGKNGQIAYITKRGGAQIAVVDPLKGEGSARLVTKPATWEHPSWSRDGRHVVANRDKALFVVDTLEGGDEPTQMFHASGNWISPSWAK